MRAINDYCCDKCSKTEERYVDTSIESYKCDCGGQMRKILNMPRAALDGTDPSLPGAYDRWARIREENAKIKAKKSWAEW